MGEVENHTSSARGAVSAQNLAKTLKPGVAVPWARLERAAFAEHPDVLDEYGFRRASRGNKAKWVLTLVAGIPLALIYFACYLAPIWGLAAVYDGVIAAAAPSPDYESAIPVAGVFYGIAGVLLVASTVHWITKGAPRNGFYQMQAGLTLVLGFATSLRVTANGRADDVTDWQLWLIPILVSMGLSLLFLLAHLVVSLRRMSRAASDTDSGGDTLARDTQALVAKRQQRIAALSSAQQAGVRSDLEAAFEELENRHVINAEESQRVRELELGALGLLAPKLTRRRWIVSATELGRD